MVVRERPEVIRKWAEMEFSLGSSLGSPMMDIGLEKKPSPSILMKGNVLLNKWRA